MAKKRTKKKKAGKHRVEPFGAGTTGRRLELVAEAKLEALLKDAETQRYEASGIQYKDGHFYIVLDNAPHIVRICTDVASASTTTTLIELQGEGSGYEEITFQPYEKQWYCLIEADEPEPKQFKPRVDAFDETFAFVESFWLDFPVETDNKGFEGLSYLRYQGEDYVLGLCEGNACKSGSRGRKPGKGRIQLFRRAPDEWTHAGTVKLPKSVQFEDYASLDLRNQYVTVLSQVTSAVWVGRIREEAHSIDDLWEDDGQIYLFPRDAKGRIIYCNLEGITWLDEKTFAVVSDKAKRGKQSKRCEDRDQSIHIFRLTDTS